MGKSKATWQTYEAEKSKLERAGLSPKEYEKALAALTKRLGL